ncbi:MAG TPA: hypothetical protein VFP23_01330, partial [Solirubrobacterales bacterium]|nr:hypothetical protein [Solirubrobacterales bacterium]
ARNTRKLAAQGTAGRATAEVAAATAPSPTVAAGGTAPSQGHRQAPAAPTGNAIGGASRPASASPSGSSGLSEAIGQATGSSSGSGQLGPLLPLLIAATVLWSLAFLWRRTRRTAR